MAVQFGVARGALAADIVNNGTFTLSYPTGYTQASFTGANAGTDHRIILNNNNTYTALAGQMSVSFGASLITVTNTSGATWMGISSSGNATAYVLQLSQATTTQFTGVKQAAIPVMVDSSGGTVTATIAAITAGASYAQADATATKNGLASLSAKVNAIIAALQGAGISA